ncbi:LppX_LprAFG lipoprotein [Amycolatopsis thermophila]|uniref:Lipoprotein LprG n=1 Tax=Amycolatopsis thermophila TaxID=206084 RepID=A0ABU0EQ11_9PSEU|nr:LppX_LprAFG lipoprotein [Amycolatopsis thermophila]MDQ0377138.1 lipoprotein LprG [Amycolatopsis thermophila]
MLRRRTAGVLALVLALSAACSSAPEQPLPEGRALVDAAEASLNGVRSVRFDFSVSSTIPGLDIREVKGQASKDGGPHGTAIGQADVQASADRFELDYVLAGETLFLTDKKGRQTQAPVPADYNPVTMLGPDRGLPKLLADATALKTETKEDVLGVEAYRVTGKLAKDVISSVVPGIQADVDVKFWVTQAEPRNLVRVWIQVPPRQPNEGAIQLELALSDQNVPVGTTTRG